MVEGGPNDNRKYSNSCVSTALHYLYECWWGYSLDFNKNESWCDTELSQQGLPDRNYFSVVYRGWRTQIRKFEEAWNSLPWPKTRDKCWLPVGHYLALATFLCESCVRSLGILVAISDTVDNCKWVDPVAIDGLTVQTEEVNSMRWDASNHAEGWIWAVLHLLQSPVTPKTFRSQVLLFKVPWSSSRSSSQLQTHKSLATTGSWFKHFLPLEKQEIGLSHCLDTRETITWTRFEPD